MERDAVWLGAGSVLRNAAGERVTNSSEESDGAAASLDGSRGASPQPDAAAEAVNILELYPIVTSQHRSTTLYHAGFPTIFGSFFSKE